MSDDGDDRVKCSTAGHVDHEPDHNDEGFSIDYNLFDITPGSPDLVTRGSLVSSGTEASIVEPSTPDGPYRNELNQSSTQANSQEFGVGSISQKSNSKFDKGESSHSYFGKGTIDQAYNDNGLMELDEWLLSGAVIIED